MLSANPGGSARFAYMMKMTTIATKTAATNIIALVGRR
jgi:hypothetical protein